MTGDSGDNGSRRAVRGFSRLYLWFAVLSLTATVVLILAGRSGVVGPFAIAVPALLALSVRDHPVLGATAFSLWMITFIAAPMFYPGPFSQWGTVSLKPFIIPLIMSVMFCMGTTLSVEDFRRVFVMPQAVLVGVALQYLVMPFVGKLSAMLFAPNPEVAAGIVITGSAPGGVASNVITFLANGNVALSVTMTAFSTLFAPIMTPTMTKLLAGEYIPVSFTAMLISILQMVIIPVGGGLMMHTLLERLGRTHRIFERLYTGIMRMLPKLSMFAIVMACAIMTANARDQLLIGSVVLSVVVAVMFHNIAGLALGYTGARLIGLRERDCRTIAIEVGMQNSGMAAGLALSVLKSELASIPGVVYSSWHNITGALIASWWRRHPPEDEPVAAASPVPAIADADA